ncbi:MAG: cell division protein FtsA [candidate division WOR-3 bacterium]|nr:cell division protein FtsA [candidate division WOR-3 bacterium]
MTISVIDIGTTSIKTIIARKEPDSGELNVIGVSDIEDTGLRKSSIVDIDRTISTIKRSVEQAKLMAGIDVKNLHASIGGDSILGFTGKGVVVTSSSTPITDNDVMRVIESTKTNSNMDDEILHVLPISYNVDKHPDIMNPVGLRGKQLQAETLIIAVPTITLQNFSNAIERAGYIHDEFIVQQVAAYNSILDNEERELGVALIDIGGGTTKISVFYNNAMRYVATIRIGGDNITQDLSIGLRTPRTEAERIKKEQGNCMREMIDYSREITIPGVHDREDRKVSMEEIVNIIEPRVVEMMDLIQKSLYDSQLYGKLNTGIVLTGGTAALKGIKELAEKHLDVPVKIGYPKGLSGLSDNINHPKYAVSAGMVRYIDAYDTSVVSHRINKNDIRNKWTDIMNSIKEMFKL